MGSKLPFLLKGLLSRKLNEAAYRHKADPVIRITFFDTKEPFANTPGEDFYSNLQELSHEKVS
ncbi:hypothetical protein ES703_57006 [subsurface metagenome]